MEDFKTLEERVLEEVVEKGQEVRLVFINGYQARVTIDEFDADALLVCKDGKRLRLNVAAGATGDIVNNHRHGGNIRDSGIVSGNLHRNRTPLHGKAE